ncbi:hypothetical protein D3875_21005 [Deinococcus cavernae]|uniref:MASE1 domain-containing protein n=1 Tax=Deinococcus cavernae TaxID=2320857 RepID=A0A418V0U4_9DEIO|nr:hypothetical protein [Deinococcus cavernae]RJF69448.1 hypothetical protein D3875_21005 [Deinococcus cavernae]
MRPEDRSLEYAAQAARSGLHGLLFVAVFIVLQRVSFLFQDAGGVSLWYLPAGLSLAYLMRSGRRNVGWVFVAIAGAGWLQSPVAVNHLAALFGTAAAWLGAELLRKWPGGTPGTSPCKKLWHCRWSRRLRGASRRWLALPRFFSDLNIPSWPAISSTGGSGTRWA